jgi:protein tyrosine phosphatase (PTP) superfamily phosphohydrolase (DUF442 family)
MSDGANSQARISHRVLKRRSIRVALTLAIASIGLLAAFWDDLVEKRVAIVEPKRLVRGAWQRPGPLRTILKREGIRTIVTLTAINRDDPKYVGQAKVVRETGVDWIIVPMRGSRATLEQMAEAADLLADPERQPVFFHCVAGHHRTSLAHAAYLIRHRGWSAERAWREVSSMPWARPRADGDDQRLIEAFAAAQGARQRSRKDDDHAATASSDLHHSADPDPVSARRAVRRGETLDGQLRHGGARPDLPLGANAVELARP